jgi:tetratricopeptide (TPR) repeat protein
MRNCKRAWFKLLVPFLWLVVTASPLYAQGIQGNATSLDKGPADDVKLWVKLECEASGYSFLIQKVQLDSKPAFQTEIWEVRRVIQGKRTGTLFIGPERIIYHAKEHPTYSFDESRTAVQWQFGYFLTLRTPRRAMDIVGILPKDDPPNTAVVKDKRCTLLSLASSDFAAAERYFQELTNGLPAVRKARWRDLQPTIAAWRTLATKPPLNAEADRHRILAEDAIKEKNLNSAVEHYEAALEVQPMWPAGWFNLALIYAEQNDYAEAADRMKHYLELVPDAPDAKSAQEQMIIWEDKAKR